MSAAAIERRLATGRLHPIHRGVYLVGHPVPPRYAAEMAALMACGEPAVLSHFSAAALWELHSHPAGIDVCVTVPPRRRIERPGIEVHRVALASSDVRRRHGLWLTSPPRTVLDLAARLDTERLELLVADARYRGLATDAELRD